MPYYFEIMYHYTKGIATVLTFRTHEKSSTIPKWVWHRWIEGGDE